MVKRNSHAATIRNYPADSLRQETIRIVPVLCSSKRSAELFGHSGSLVSRAVQECANSQARNYDTQQMHVRIKQRMHINRRAGRKAGV